MDAPHLSSVSAGALVDSLHVMGARRISIVAPYMKPLTKMVADYIEEEGVEVADFVALEIPTISKLPRRILRTCWTSTSGSI